METTEAQTAAYTKFVECIATLENVAEPEVMFEIEGVVSGGAINYSPPCYAEAVQGMLDAAPEEATEEIEEITEEF